MKLNFCESVVDEAEDKTSQQRQAASGNVREEPKPQEDPYVTELKKEMGDKICQILFKENLHESTRPSRRGSYNDYKKALEVADNKTLPALIKFFIFQETGKKDSEISPRLLSTVKTQVQSSGIDPLFNNELGAFLNYIDIQRQLPKPWFFDTLDLIEIDPIVDLVNGSTIDDAIQNKLAVIYTKSFWNYSAVKNDLAKLYRIFYNKYLSPKSLQQIIQKQSSLAEGESTQIKKLLGNAFVTDPIQLRKAILLNNNNFRSLVELTKFVNAAQKDMTSQSANTNNDDSDSDENTDTNTTQIAEAEYDKIIASINSATGADLSKKVANILRKYPNAQKQDAVAAFKAAFLGLLNH